MQPTSLLFNDLFYDAGDKTLKKGNKRKIIFFANVISISICRNEL